MTMKTKCKRVRFRIIGQGRHPDAFACRMNEGRLMFMSIDPVTLKETHKNDQRSATDFKNFEDFQVNRSSMSCWKELRRPS